MSNGFGAGGGPGGFGPGDYDNLVRQYWNGWGEMMRKAAVATPSAVSGMPPGLAGMPGTPGFDAGGVPVPGWNEALAWWTNLAKGGPAGGAVPGIQNALDHFNSQARSWFELMQQVAAQATPGSSASDITQAWQNALGGLGDNPFADMFRSMRGPGQVGFDGWLDQASPYLQGFGGIQGDGQSLLGQPTFGFTREHQQRWQQLMQAQMEYQQHSNAYNELMAEAARNAFKLFETKLAERSEPGRQIESARALFDLWIEAAEEAYAEIALSPRFREAYGSMVNSQMRLRAGLQREVEQACELFGMPTRTEVDSAHRKVVQVERELRRIRDALEALGGIDELIARAAASVAPVRRSPPAKKATKRAATKAATKAIPAPAKVRKAAARKAVASPSAPVTARQRPVTRTPAVPAKIPARKAKAPAKAAAKQPAKKVATKAATKPAKKIAKKSAARATKKPVAKPATSWTARARATTADPSQTRAAVERKRQAKSGKRKR